MVVTKQIRSLSAWTSVSQHPGSSIEQSRTDKHDKLLWFYRCSQLQDDPKISKCLFIRLGLMSTSAYILKKFNDEMLPALQC